MNFEDFLRQHKVPVAPAGHEHVRPGWIQFDCPWCSPNWGHYRMGYNTSYHFVNCWACGRHKLLETVCEATGLPFGVVAKALRGLETTPKLAKPERTGLVMPKGLVELQWQHIKYLKGRKYDWQQLQQLWELKAFTTHSRFPWRIFIPIHQGGRVVSFTTRSIQDEGQRYISAKPSEESTDHKSLLYGEDYCRHCVVVCEGPTDVWRVGPGAVCTFGTGYSSSQVARIATYPIRVICFDSQSDAQRQAKGLCDLLEPLPGTTYNVVLDSKDPGAATKREIRELRERFLE